MTDEERQEIVDGEHLRALSICYVVGGVVHVVSSVFGLSYVVVGVVFAALLAGMPGGRDASPAPEAIGLFFGLFGFFTFVILLGLGAVQLLAARRLKQRRSRVLCMVVAGVTCVGIPYGTVLGVITFLVLARPSVVRAFTVEDGPATTPAG